MAAEARLKIMVDGEASFTASLKNIEQQSKTLAAEMKALSSSFDKNATAQDKARAKMQVLEKQISTQKTYLDKLNQGYNDQKKKLEEIAAEYEKVTAEQGKDSAAAQKLANEYVRQETALSKTEEKINKAQNALNKMESELRECEAAAKGLSLGDKFREAGTKIQEAGEKVTAFGDKLSNIGKSASVATAAVVAVGKKAVDAFKEVDAGADTIVTKTGASGQALENMQSSMERLATTIPTTFDAAGEAIGEVNTRFGVTGDELETLSGQFVKFAEINGVEITGAVDSAQKAMAAFNVDVKDAGGFLDLLTVQAQRTGISTDALTQSMVTNGPALKEMGMSADTAAVFLADLEVSGTDASAVLTGMKKALTNAAKEGKPMSDAMKDISDKIKNAKTETDGINAATELFGAKAGPAMYKALKEGQISFEDLASGVNDFDSALGATDKTFENTLDPIDELKVTSNSLKMGLADLANTAMTALAPSFQKLTAFVKDLADRFKNLSPETQTLILKIAGIVAAVGPLLLIGGKLTTAFGSVMKFGGKIAKGAGKLADYGPKIGAAISQVGTVFKAVGTAIMAHPVIAIAAVIAGIIAYLVHLYKTNEEFRDKVNAVLDSLKKKWEAFKEGFHNVIEAIKTKLQEWHDKFAMIKEAIAFIIVSIATTIHDKIETMKQAFQSFKDKVQSIIDAVKQKFENLKQSVINIADNVKSKFNNMKDGVSNAIENVKTKIQSLADKVLHVKDKIAQYIQNIKDFFKNLVLKIPKPSLPKLPHFEVTWTTKSFLGQEVSVPHVGVNWYDKGGIFRNPSIIGVGEKRPEFVGALDDLRKIVREESGGTVTINVYGAEGQDVRQLANIVMDKINTQMRRESGAFA